MVAGAIGLPWCLGRFREAAILASLGVVAGSGLVVTMDRLLGQLTSSMRARTRSAIVGGLLLGPASARFQNRAFLGFKVISLTVSH